jgi:hypothetical protein
MKGRPQYIVMEAIGLDPPLSHNPTPAQQVNLAE